MNDSRLKVYEQLEVSMVELERTNKRLGEEGLGDKEKIRDLGDTVRSLEIKCEELQRLLDEVILRARPGDARLGPDVTCQVRTHGDVQRSVRPKLANGKTIKHILYTVVIYILFTVTKLLLKPLQTLHYKSQVQAKHKMSTLR